MLHRIAVAALLATAGAVAGVQQVVAQQVVAPRDTAHRSSAFAEFTYVSFDDDVTEAWKLGSAGLIRRTGIGPVIGRVNYANRTGGSGFQFEGEAYPRITDRTYAYLDVGYSEAVVFPQWRGGAELFANLPRAFELSGGVRQLRFSGVKPVTLITGTVGKYEGNYWFSLRPYFREELTGNEFSATLTARLYAEDASHYVGARLGHGSTPGDRLTVGELARTTSTTADIHGSTDLGKLTFATWQVGWEREAFPANRHRNRWTFGAGLRTNF